MKVYIIDFVNCLAKMYLQSYTGIISSRFSSCIMARPTRELALSSRASRSSSAGG